MVQNNRTNHQTVKVWALRNHVWCYVQYLTSSLLSVFSFSRLRLLSSSPSSSTASTWSDQWAQWWHQPWRPWWRRRWGQPRSGRGWPGSRAHPHTGGSPELAGGDRRGTTGKDDGKCRIGRRGGAWVGRAWTHLYGQLHAKEETALYR